MPLAFKQEVEVAKHLTNDREITIAKLDTVTDGTIVELTAQRSEYQSTVYRIRVNSIEKFYTLNLSKALSVFYNNIERLRFL